MSDEARAEVERYTRSNIKPNYTRAQLDGEEEMTSHRPAPLVIRWWLRATGFQAITMPWHRAYYWPWPADPGLIAHEQVHLDQLARLGPLRFVARYLWLLIRHGYERHPMEIEAREISGHR